MNRKYLVAILASFCISIPLAAQDSSTVGPFVWTGHFVNLDTFVPRPAYPLASPVVSSFTPDRRITVTRVELRVASGAHKSATFPPASCDVVPAVQVTDGTNSFSLEIPNAPIDDHNHAGPVSADSGPITLEFARGAKLSIAVIPGDVEPEAKICSAGEGDITVQYRIRLDHEHEASLRGRDLRYTPALSGYPQTRQVPTAQNLLYLDRLWWGPACAALTKPADRPESRIT